MIYDHEVRFYSKKDRKYNPHTHGHEGEIKEVGSLIANVTDLGTNRSVELFGNYSQNSLVVRTIKEPPISWDYMTIDNGSTHYKRQTQRKPLKYCTLIVGESDE